MGCGLRKLGLGRFAGYDVVRVILGLILLAAAVLKGHQLAREPVLGTGLLDSRFFLIGVVEFEFLFGLWLLAGMYPKLTWLAAISCFACFASVSLAKALSGESSCGCFGRVAVDPWYTLGLDTVAVIALLRWEPVGTEPRSLTSFRSALLRVGCVAAVWLIVGIPAGMVMGSQNATTFSEAGEILGEGDFVVLEPETWVGKRFPLLPYIDIGDRLAEGGWLVVLHRHRCPRCERSIREYQRLAADLGWSWPIALVEIPSDSGGGYVSQESSCTLGHLGHVRRWFITVPVEIVLLNGIVVGVSEGESLASGRASGGF